MTLTTHALVGAALGTMTGNSLGAFMLGFASHFFVDAIPHGHYPFISFLRSRDPQRPYSRRALVVIAFDFLLALLFPMLLFSSTTPPFVVLLAAVGSILPDLLFGFDIYFPSRLTRSFVRLHEGAHFFFFPQSSWQFPMPLILATEFGVIFLSLTFLL